MAEKVNGLVSLLNAESHKNAPKMAAIQEKVRLHGVDSLTYRTRNLASLEVFKGRGSISWHIKEGMKQRNGDQKRRQNTGLSD